VLSGPSRHALEYLFSIHARIISLKLTKLHGVRYAIFYVLVALMQKSTKKIKSQYASTHMPNIPPRIKSIPALKSVQPVTITLEAALQGTPVVGANVSMIQGLGIMFFEQIGSVYYPLGQGNAMKLVDIF
jgi:hypothetical protein